jgi:hypothetical protein
MDTSVGTGAGRIALREIPDGLLVDRRGHRVDLSVVAVGDGHRVNHLNMTSTPESGVERLRALYLDGAAESGGVGKRDRRTRQQVNDRLSVALERAQL